MSYRQYSEHGYRRPRNQQMDYPTAWGDSAAFSPADFAQPAEYPNTQFLPQSPSSTLSYDPSLNGHYGGYPMQLCDSGASSLSPTSYNNSPSSPLAGMETGVLHSSYNSHSYPTTVDYSQNQDWQSPANASTAGQYGFDGAQARPSRSRSQTQDVPYIASSAAPQFICVHPGCDAGAFARTSDLARHIKHVHGSKDQLEVWYCDYKNCSRSKSAEQSSGSARGPFSRKDHYKAHLREYHVEALPKRNVKSDTSWQSKTFKDEWWRCLECLNRNWVKKNSRYICKNCNKTLEKEVYDQRQKSLEEQRGLQQQRY